MLLPKMRERASILSYATDKEGLLIAELIEDLPFQYFTCQDWVSSIKDLSLMIAELERREKE